MRRLLSLGLLAIGGAVLASASQDASGQAAAGRLTDAERMLSELKFDAAVGALTEVIAAIPQPPPDEASLALLSRALDLRAQAQASLGRGEAAEADFERLVRTNASYELDEKTISPKIVQRFKKIRARLIGALTVTCDPPGAALLLDGRPAGSCPLTEIPVVAGEHVLAGSHAGFDPGQITISVTVGEKKEARLDLQPNARDIVLQTVPAGVEVLVDGAPAGVTAPGAEGPDGVSARLTLPAVEPGEHAFTFRKECHAEQLRRFTVVVDLLDRSPVQIQPVEVPRARSQLSVTSTPPEALISLDGRALGQTPLTGQEVCAGKHSIEVRFAEGARWKEEVDLAAGKSVEISARPRPDLAFSLSGDPVALSSLGEEEAQDLLQRIRDAVSSLQNYNIQEAPAAAPAPNTSPPSPDPISAAGLSLSVRVAAGPVSSRLAVSVVSSFHSAPETWDFDVGDAPGWTGLLSRLDEPIRLERRGIGLIVVDTLLADAPVVLAVRAGTPAAAAGLAPGDQIVTADGEKLSGAGAFWRLWSDPPRSSRELDVSRQGTVRRVSLSSVSSPALIPFAEPDDLPYSRKEIVSYHKAAVEASLAAAMAAGEPLRSLARLNLMAALLHFGENAQALREASRKLELPGGAGLSRGTAFYLAGIAYERMGMRAEAATAFQSAAAEPDATLDGLDGLPLAPAARARAEILSSGTSSQPPSSAPSPAPPDPAKPEDRRPIR